MRNVLLVVLTNDAQAVCWAFLYDCKRRGGRRRMAHTAHDVIDQHVNYCSKIPSVYMVYIFPSYEAGMRRKEAQKQNSSLMKN